MKFSVVRGHPWVAALAIVGGFAGLFFTFCLPSFETNDDIVMSLIASGKLIAVAPDAHLLFSNILVGKALSTLYSWRADVPWYGLYLIGLHALAVAGISWAVLRGGVTLVRFGLLAAYLSVVELYQLRYLQFTNTASLCGQAALLLVLSWCLHRPSSLARGLGILVAAFALAVCGILVRSDAVLLAAPLALPSAAIAFFRTTECRVGLLSWFSAIGLAYLGLTAVDRKAYEGDPQWQGVREFNSLRNRITDLGPDLGLSPVEIAKLRASNLAAAGWSLNDFRMLHAWGFLDKNKFTNESFRSYLDGMPQFRRPSMIVRQLIVNLVQLRMIPVFLLLICVLTHVDWSGRNRLAVLATLLFGVLTLILLASYMKLARRVVLPSFSFASLIALLYVRADRYGQWQVGRWTLQPRWSIPCVGVGLLCLWGLEFHLTRVQVAANAEFRQDLSQLKSDKDRAKDCLYVSFGGSLPIECLMPLESTRYLDDIRCLFLGWTNRTPHTDRLLASFQIDDLFEALTHRADVVAIAPPSRRTEFSQQYATDVLFSVLPDYLAESYGVRPEFDDRFEGRRIRVVKLQSEGDLASKTLEKR